jgi:FkbM family methyltransferase
VNARTLLRRAVQQGQLLAHRAGYDVTRETFKRHFVRALRDHGVQSVLDLGANTGQFALALRRGGFDGRIVSVEPLAAPYAALVRRAALDPEWVAVRSAVGSETGVLRVHVAANSVSSSVLPMLDRHAEAAPNSRYVDTEEVVATTVDELVAEYRLDPSRTLLKIDVQGYELPVLHGARDTMKQIAAVRAELSLVPLYAGQALLPDLLAELEGHGLELWNLERGFVDPVSGRLLQVDGVFFRPVNP